MAEREMRDVVAYWTFFTASALLFLRVNLKINRGL